MFWGEKRQCLEKDRNLDVFGEIKNTRMYGRKTKSWMFRGHRNNEDVWRRDKNLDDFGGNKRNKNGWRKDKKKVGCLGK